MLTLVVALIALTIAVAALMVAALRRPNVFMEPHETVVELGTRRPDLLVVTTEGMFSNPAHIVAEVERRTGTTPLLLEEGAHAYWIDGPDAPITSEFESLTGEAP